VIIATAVIAAPVIAATTSMVAAPTAASAMTIAATAAVTTATAAVGGVSLSYTEGANHESKPTAAANLAILEPNFFSELRATCIMIPPRGIDSRFTFRRELRREERTS
jgi:hypothetical protein